MTLRLKEIQFFRICRLFCLTFKKPKASKGHFISEGQKRGPPRSNSIFECLVQILFYCIEYHRKAEGQSNLRREGKD